MMMVVPDQAAVTAIVVTHNSLAAVTRCLDAVAAQTHAPARVLVIDNASDAEVPDGLPLDPTVIRLPENLGPAGGFARGLRAFLDGPGDYAWLMDDDCFPFADGLDQQLAVASENSVVLATVVDDGEVVRGHGWWGALIPRVIVERVGLPREDFFWWTEDTEYLQWRIPRSGGSVTWTEAPVMEISRGRRDASKPVWKYYYESRNQVYFRLWVQRTDRRPKPRHLKLRVRAWRSGRSVSKLAVRSLVREHDQRAEKLWMVGRGTIDGILGRLGRRVPVGDADRPIIAAPPAGEVS
jgi:GT2 family glycosyltransferase